jgi:hypothetical protein
MYSAFRLVASVDLEIAQTGMTADTIGSIVSQDILELAIKFEPNGVHALRLVSATRLEQDCDEGFMAESPAAKAPEEVSEAKAGGQDRYGGTTPRGTGDGDDVDSPWIDPSSAPVDGALTRQNIGLTAVTELPVPNLEDDNYILWAKSVDALVAHETARRAKEVKDETEAREARAKMTLKAEHAARVKSLNKIKKWLIPTEDQQALGHTSVQRVSADLVCQSPNTSVNGCASEPKHDQKASDEADAQAEGIKAVTVKHKARGLRKYCNRRLLVSDSDEEISGPEEVSKA